MAKLQLKTCIGYTIVNLTQLYLYIHGEHL